MEIITLIDNNIGKDENLVSEHGLAILIRSEYGDILFDTGQSDNFINNAEKLGVDLSNVKYVVLSHAHFDHCNGYKHLISKLTGSKPKLIISENFFSNGNKYHYSCGAADSAFHEEEGYHFIGANFDEEFLESNNIIREYVTEAIHKVNEEVYVFSNFRKVFAFERLNPNLVVNKDRHYQIDDFREEISIGIKTKKGMLILLGCAHVGCLNIVENIKYHNISNIIGVIGGTHFIECDSERIGISVKYLNELNLEYLGLSHCTGETATKILEKECNNTFINSTGTVIRLE